MGEKGNAPGLDAAQGVVARGTSAARSRGGQSIADRVIDTVEGVAGDFVDAGEAGATQHVSEQVKGKLQRSGRKRAGKADTPDPPAGPGGKPEGDT